MRAAVPIIAGLTLLACRADAPAPDPTLLEWEAPQGYYPEPLEGPDPWVAGERRLNLGLFYEGGASDFMAIDNASANYYIFETTDGLLTYTQIEDPDRIEGLVSSRIVRSGTPWLGGGIVWSAARDLSTWTLMALSLKSSDESFATVTISMETEGGDAALSMADYGFDNDGQWHQLVIPMTDFEEAGADLTRVTAPFVMAAVGGPAGESFNIDALYLTGP